MPSRSRSRRILTRSGSASGPLGAIPYTTLGLTNPSSGHNLSTRVPVVIDGEVRIDSSNVAVTGGRKAHSSGPDDLVREVVLDGRLDTDEAEARLPGIHRLAVEPEREAVDADEFDGVPEALRVIDEVLESEAVLRNATRLRLLVLVGAGRVSMDARSWGLKPGDG